MQHCLCRQGASAFDNIEPDVEANDPFAMFEKGKDLKTESLAKASENCRDGKLDQVAGNKATALDRFEHITERAANT